MENLVENTVESRKEWATPELKKISIEEITAANYGITDDGQSGAS